MHCCMIYLGQGWGASPPPPAPSRVSRPRAKPPPACPPPRRALAAILVLCLYLAATFTPALWPDYGAGTSPTSKAAVNLALHDAILVIFW